MSMSLLRVEGLRVRVGGVEVVRGVSIEVGEGEVHVLMGPNGSGKSTLLRAVMGLPGYEVVEGRVLYRGLDVTGLNPSERAKWGVALMHQNPRPVSVKLSHIVGELSRLYGLPPSAVQLLGLNGLMDRELFRGFSGGEVKRVELALTIMQRPSLAMLDEPDSGVDLDSLKVVGRVINSLIDSGAGVLLVTHTGAIAEYLRRVTAAHVMVGGRVVASGDLAEILWRVRERGYESFNEGGVQ